MSAPSSTSTGSWIGGLWPSADAWRTEWLTAWSTIGWLAGVSIQVDLNRANLERMNHAAGEAFKKVDEQLHNVGVDVKKLQRKANKS